MRSLALLALLTVAACGSQHSSGLGTRQAVLRTPPVATCTADQQKVCPAVQALACPAGQEPVIDYSSDCCAHVTCQPICSASAPCPATPAPACPVGTHLWIGTAVEDCCPAFRCDPDAPCDPTKGSCQPPQPQCATDADCPAGERCEATCVGWGCATAGGATVGGTAGGSTAAGCACPPNDTTCSCDPSGTCTGQICTSHCAPASPACDPAKPPPCPMSFPACPGGQQPVAAGADPTTCCPIYKCPVCPMTASAIACPMIPVCKCATQVGIDPSTCCPSYACGSVDPATGNCL